MTDNRTNPLRRPVSRRQFVTGAAALAGAAGLAGVLPDHLARAATAKPQHFDLSQVKHVVFVMMENRSFDHYFGTFPDARGFNDPTAVRLPNGRSVFQQPDPSNPDGTSSPITCPPSPPAPPQCRRCRTTGGTSMAPGTTAAWTAG